MYSKQYLNDLEQLHAICLRNTTGVTNWAGTELLSLPKHMSSLLF